MRLTQGRLKELLNYAPENGLFTWKVSTPEEAHQAYLEAKRKRHG